MTYGLVYRHSSQPTSIVPAGESTILSSTIIAPLAATKELVANESEVILNTQKTPQVLNSDENITYPLNFRKIINSTTNKYGIRSKYGQPVAFTTPLIFQLRSSYPSHQYASVSTTTFPARTPLVMGLNYGHRQYEVEENEKDASNNVSDDTGTEG